MQRPVIVFNYERPSLPRQSFLFRIPLDILFKKHQFQIAGLRSHDEYVTDDIVAEKRVLADQLRADPALFARVQSESAAKLATIPVSSKGVKAGRKGMSRPLALSAAAVAGATGLLLFRRRK